jgi:hypothetical protein
MFLGLNELEMKMKQMQIVIKREPNVVSGYVTAKSGKIDVQIYCKDIVDYLMNDIRFPIIFFTEDEMERFKTYCVQKFNADCERLRLKLSPIKVKPGNTIKFTLPCQSFDWESMIVMSISLVKALVDATYFGLTSLAGSLKLKAAGLIDDVLDGMFEEEWLESLYNLPSMKVILHNWMIEISDDCK